jgi:hypothetical protein
LSRTTVQPANRRWDAASSRAFELSRTGWKAQDNAGQCDVPASGHARPPNRHPMPYGSEVFDISRYPSPADIGGKKRLNWLE